MAAFVSGWCHQRYRDISGPRGHWGVSTSQSEASEWRVLTNQRPVSAVLRWGQLSSGTREMRAEITCTGEMRPAIPGGNRDLLHTTKSRK